jgi:hypothetical protein
MLNNGIPVLVVSKMLGHAKPSTTLNVYGHLTPGMQAEAAELMDDITTPIRIDLGKDDDVDQETYEDLEIAEEQEAPEDQN